MKLWTAHLDALEGFYASDVYVGAADRETALARVMLGVPAYVADRVENYGCMPGISCCAYEDEWRDELVAFFTRVGTEAREKLQEVPGAVIINVRI